MKNTKFILKLAAILFAIAFICTLLLVLCNEMTKDRIAALQTEAENAAKSEVLPEAESFEDTKEENVVAAYIGKKDGETVGYCLKVEPSGFGGAVSMIVGINTEGVVTGVKITSMTETPGLGAKASDESWLGQFVGKNGDISVVKTGNAKDNQINAISGATVTSKAVAKGVNDALAAVDKIMKQEGK